MNLTINGESRVFAPADTLASLVEQLRMKSDRVAIELNRELVPREQWAQTPVKDGDRLEIVHFVGGGSLRRSHAEPPYPRFRNPSVQQSDALFTRKHAPVHF